MIVMRFYLSFMISLIRPVLSTDILPIQPSAQQLDSLKTMLSSTLKAFGGRPEVVKTKQLVKQSRGFQSVKSESDNLNDSLMGDMQLTAAQVDNMISAFQRQLGTRHRRQFELFDSLFKTWPVDKPIPYSYDSNVTPDIRKAVETAIEWWETETCVQFTKKAGAINRLKFADGAGCSSYVGMLPGVTNLIILQSGYCGAANAAHEIAHSLGAIHEHQRADRDVYITINTENVGRAALYDFAMRYDFKKSYDNTPYDYGSLMHYASTAGKRMEKGHENENVIITKDPIYQQTIGQRTAISFIDAKRINQLYCANKCQAELDCKNGGYPNPKNCRECKCPDGFGGQFCTRVQYTTANCGGDLEASTEPTNLKSPNYPHSFPTNINCYWLIRAPKGHQVHLQFIRPFDMGDCQIVCQSNFVEVKKGQDFGPTGARLCCPPAPHTNFTSNGELMAVILRTGKQSANGFQAVFKSIQSGSVDSTPSSGSTSEILENFVRRKTTAHSGENTKSTSTTSTHSSKSEKTSTRRKTVASSTTTTPRSTTESLDNCDKKSTILASISCLERKITQLLNMNARTRNLT